MAKNDKTSLLTDLLLTFGDERRYEIVRHIFGLIPENVLRTFYEKNKLSLEAGLPTLGFIFRRFTPLDKDAESLIRSFTSEIIDEFKRRFENGYGGGKDGKNDKGGTEKRETPAAEDFKRGGMVTIRQAVGSMKSADNANEFAERLSKSSLDETEKKKILDSYFREKEAWGLIATLAECEEPSFETIAKMLFDITKPVPPPEKVIVCVEITSGKYPNLERYITAAELFDAVEKKSKMKALLDLLEKLSKQELESTLKALNASNENAFKSYIQGVYKKSNYDTLDDAGKVLRHIKGRINEPVKGKVYASPLAAFMDGFTSTRR